MPNQTQIETPDEWEDVAGIGPKRAERLREDVGEYDDFRSNSRNAQKNKIARAVSGNRRNLPEFAQNAVEASSARSRSTDNVDSDLVTQQQVDQRTKRTRSKTRMRERDERADRTDLGFETMQRDREEVDKAAERLTEEFEGPFDVPAREVGDAARDVINERQGGNDRATAQPLIGAAASRTVFASRMPGEQFRQELEQTAEQTDRATASPGEMADAFVEFVDREVGLRSEITVGEFTPDSSAHNKAEGRFSSSLNRGRGRSQNAAIADKSKRAPVTTDFERWKSNKGELDFPGVDTPSASPDVRPKDLKQQQRPDTTEPTEDKRAVERAETTIGDSNLLESEAEASATDSDVVGAFVSGRAESRDVSVSRGEAVRGERTDSIVSFAGPQFDANRERPRETDRREREEEMGIVPEQAFMQSDSSVAEELNDLYDNGDSDESVPTRPYESRNDGPPSQVGPYELAQDKQNDGFRTVAFENKESDRSVVFQTYNTDLDGPGATVDVSYGDNTETIAEGDADSVYQQFIGELEERRDRNQEREPSDGSGIQSRANERLNAAQNLFGGDR